MVAMMAKEHRIPVVACVETYKFGERVQLDGVANNELGIGEELFKIPPKSGRNGVEIKEGLRGGVTPLCLLYDLTPPELITAVCTEVSPFFSYFLDHLGATTTDMCRSGSYRQARYRRC